MKKKILFTGGGSAGHVTVNLALIPKFKEEDWEVEYIGSENGIEKQLLSTVENVKYHSIATGKLRRYFDWNNFKDPFKVLKGIVQAYRIMKQQKPNIVFSKGGFVSVPVVLGAWLNKIPVIIHESDLTPGLANKLAIPFASKVCTTFPETNEHLKSGKGQFIGAIVREELKQGNAEKGHAFCHFKKDQPVLLVMGGSLGSQKINRVVRENLDALLSHFQIVHICGKGQVDSSINRAGYKQFEYIQQELPDIMAMADLVVSRAGSNSIFEFLALKKPMLLIPLSRAASRGDQILNARSFEKQGYAQVLEEEELTNESFLKAVTGLYENREIYLENMSKNNAGDPLTQVFDLIKEEAKY